MADATRHLRWLMNGGRLIEARDRRPSEGDGAGAQRGRSLGLDIEHWLRSLPSLIYAPLQERGELDDGQLGGPLASGAGQGDKGECRPALARSESPA